jgi:two-component system cell cycle sensor histidine kinase/response regulator CckA
MKSLSILNIEDSEADYALVGRHLAKAGYDVYSERIETAEAMRASLSSREWDLIISDYQMPSFSALQAFEVLKKSGLEIPFIIISGTIGEEAAVKALLSGVNDYLMKDNLNRLGPAIERGLDEAKNRRIQRETEEALRRSEERYRLLFDKNPLPMWVYDIETLRFLAVNTAAIEHYGFSEDEFRAMTIKDIRPAEEVPTLLENLSKADDVIDRVDEWRHQKKDGTIINVEVTSHELIFDEKRARLVLVNDITKRIQAEEELRKTEEQLILSQKLESVGRLAGGIAHDFNNMLTAINGYSELTLRQLREDDPLRPHIEEIKKAGERSADLTRQLLAFSRRQMLQPKVLDINKIVSDTAVMLQRLIGEDISLISVLGSDVAPIEADPGQLSQVILNLVVNARDAMPTGGTITIETKNVYLDEQYAKQHIAVKPGPYVMLSVSDTGTGMDAVTQKQIFEPFFTTKELGKGTGLGLATVYGIVKQSNGNIWVYSEVGKGTAFKIYLPRIEEGSDAPVEHPSPAGFFWGTETILVVEDEDMVRSLSREVLESCGYTVLEATNGMEALSMCAEHEINLLITDIVMPQMGGRELAEKLSEAYPKIRVLFTSGYTDDAIVRHGIIEDDASFIQKPFNLDALARRVRELLDLRKT